MVPGAGGHQPRSRAQDLPPRNLSERENRTVSDGLRGVLIDHLEDVVDRDGRAELILRSGDSMAVESGSWFVNCTGYLLQGGQQHEPVVSTSGNVASINMRAHTLRLTPWSAYVFTHLLLRGELVAAPPYELDTMALREIAPNEIGAAVGTLMLHNFSAITDLLPPKVLLECGSDLEGWYPWPRRLVGTVRFLATHRRAREHWRRVLDHFRERHGIAGGLRGYVGSALTSRSRRRAVSAVTARLGCTTSLLRRGGTLTFSASRYCDRPPGSRHSSSSTSPGGTGASFAAIVTSSWWSMISTS